MFSHSFFTGTGNRGLILEGAEERGVDRDVLLWIRRNVDIERERVRSEESTGRVRSGFGANSGDVLMRERKIVGFADESNREFDLE